MTPGQARTLPGGRRLAGCAAASLVLHGLALALWALAPAAPPRPAPELEGGDDGDEEPEELVYVDIETPPEAPEAHAPVAPLPEPAPAPAAATEPAPDPEPIADPAALRADAASPASADAGLSADAGPGADAGPLPRDALPLPEQQTPRDAGPAPRRPVTDAGPAVASGPRDASAAGTAAARAAGDAGALPAGAAADLTPYAPSGDIVTVLLRLDRIRGTPWEAPVRAIVEPMPDYRAIIGDRDVELADHLDLLLITSPEPRSVTATTLAARSRGRADALRELLDHERAPIGWRRVRGGLLGMRRPGPAHHPADPRVYLIPSALDGWLVLARPEHLGALVDPPAATGAEETELPDWVRAIPDVAAEAGEDAAGPMAVVSARGLPRSIHVPRVGEVPAPRHVAMAVEIDPRGFRIRGTLTFDDAGRAEDFEAVANSSIERLVGSAWGRLFLRQMHAYNAARGLSFHRLEDRIGYATSVSVADGRAGLDFAAEWTARFFGREPADAGPSP